MSTPYHAAYYAYELTKRSSSDSLEKLGASMLTATVDLNPHQLDAALFAFRSPLSRGAILADEVGLGKTIEAGLIISQLWAEHKRRILIIAPTILRKQWAQELADKFHIRALVVDSREYTDRLKRGEMPLEPEDRIVICSYHFARSKSSEIGRTRWDLVVIDEAHRLRNVYKPSNKIANAIKDAVRERPMLLLTATPLQNTLLELYGLVGFIDERLFGDIDTFRARYMRGPIEDRELEDLRARLQGICQRTLRRQVHEYVRFTKRIAITQDFTPTPDEQRLYEYVSGYLQREVLNALPSSQRMLMTLVLRKLLASSTFAIAGTLERLAQRLVNDFGNPEEAVEEDFEAYAELREEWSDNSAEQGMEEKPEEPLIDEDIAAEIEELRSYGSLAASITNNAKGMELLKALAKGFEKLEELGALRKAVIFTESRRTQTYLFDLLSANGYDGKVMTLNGTNTDDRAGDIYKAWVDRHQGEEVVTGNKTVDLRAALVEQFRDHAEILIATEAASEGVNLQFCSLVVNYDLPWNPQRIEQRIGRCHRYGQKHDVVVINFLNRANAADQRVFQLLSEKLKLFEGVFGASDEVLGALESGVDFERRIAEIYQRCRTREEIDNAFAELQRALEEQINARMADTRAKLIEHFDDEVRQRFKHLNDDMRFLDELGGALWKLTRFELDGAASFNDAMHTFELDTLGADWPSVPSGTYQLIRPGFPYTHHHPYRFGDELSVAAIGRAKERVLEAAEIRFDYSGHGSKIGLLDPLVGKSGWLMLRQFTVSALDDEDQLLCALVTDEGTTPPTGCGGKLFQLRGASNGSVELPETVAAGLRRQIEHQQGVAIEKISQRNNKFFNEEIEKLERWADDLKHGLEVELKDLDARIKAVRKESRTVPTLEAKLDMHRTINELEAERSRKRRSLFEAEDEIDRKREGLIDQVAGKLVQKTTITDLFTIRWSVV